MLLYVVTASAVASFFSRSTARRRIFGCCLDNTQNPLYARSREAKSLKKDLWKTHQVLDLSAVLEGTSPSGRLHEPVLIFVVSMLTEKVLCGARILWLVASLLAIPVVMPMPGYIAGVRLPKQEAGP